MTAIPRPSTRTTFAIALALIAAQAIILYAMALLKSVFSADASQVTLKLFLSRVNHSRSLALLCWSLNDCFAFL